MISLDHQTAVITGASSGIGCAIASELARRHVLLCLVGRDAAKLYELQQTLATDSPQARVCKADLSVESDIHHIAAEALNRFGAVNMLVHCAGYLSPGDLEEATQGQLHQHLSVNYTAPLLLSQLLLPALKKAQGQIVFVNSSAIQRAIPSLGLYSSAKLALKGLADCLRAEINPYGVRVISVYPGQTDTPMQQQLHAQEGRDYRPERLMRPQDVAEAVLNALSMSPSAEVTDIYIRPMRAQ
jgi:short-subunit dehydrogenase